MTTESKKRDVALVVDDSPETLRLLTDALDGAGMTVVVDDSTDEVVGLHMIGPDAPEILQAAAIAVKAKLKKAQFDEVVALHPTMAEELVLMR